MKILFLSENFPPQNIGGAEVASFRLAKGLQEKGHSVFVITTTHNQLEAGRAEYFALTIFKIYVKKYHPIFNNYLGLYNHPVVVRVREIIKEIRPDIIHAQNINYYISYYSLKIARKYAKGVFLTANDVMLFSNAKLDHFIDRENLTCPNESTNYRVSFWGQMKIAKKRFNPFKNIVIRHYLGYVDKIFAVSNVLKKALNDNKITNTDTIYYGLGAIQYPSEEEIKKFQIKHRLDNDKVILFGGRLGPQKGGEIAVRVLEMVLQKVPNALLLIVGHREGYGEHMWQIAKQLGIENRVRFTGWLDSSTMHVAYASATICITPSICLDTFNLFNLEAMAYGKPVVGTCFGGTPEVIKDKETGFVVNPLNTHMMADKIILLLQDSNLTRKMGEAGIKRAKEYFSMERQTKQTLDWYEKIISKK